MAITPEQFEAAVGHPPDQDDMHRCNCEHAGEMGHWACGWDAEENLPVFLTDRPMRPKKPPEA